MGIFENHLKFLIDYREGEPIHQISDEIRSWKARQQAIRQPDASSQWEEVEDPGLEGNSSTLARFRRDTGPRKTPGVPANVSLIIQNLRSKPALQPLLPAVSGVLSSSRSDDDVFTELTDILGYEEMDLLIEAIKYRQYVGKELNTSEEMDHTATQQAAETVDYDIRADRQGKGKQRAANVPDDGRVTFTAAEAKARIANSLAAAAARPLFSGHQGPEAPLYPHVYATSSGHGNVLSSFGSKFMLPLGTTRHETEECEEVIIPPARPVPPKVNERLIPVEELEPIAKGSFPGYQTLNRIQSIIYPTAFKTNENLLVCAPTGAGKTDVAMLTILRVLDQYRTTPSHPTHTSEIAATIKRDDFKVIYVAPMKALASEIVRKLGKRLAWLSIRVRELTGDMQMTKAEIAETQIIVTTPEKWDVVTRKPTGEGELATKVKLLILDEVHLLNEERGAVIETIVARTQRQVESSQLLIRVVGLSATLPNYVDVAEFLGVSLYHGLFFFDSSFRPVPLEQHFIGIKGKANSAQQRRNLDRVTFDKVSELVREGHQVMVFVHARKETVKSALALKEAVLTDGTALDAFDPTYHPQWDSFRREISSSRNKEMKELFDHGFGIHHAGMLRADRNKMEKFFEARAIKVLFCTATLAWGVNLPAHAVLIKGTRVYDSAQGKFVDISVLDVLQIFGRAGRPGMETNGIGYICTADDKLDHYLDLITSQHPIESSFRSGIIDALNAEVSLGTVTNIDEAAQWLSYTYLFVRMQKNPMVYGMKHSEPIEDPRLEIKRRDLVTTAAKELADAQMLQFNRVNGTLTITDLGRIAAKYYIRHSSVVTFNKELRPLMTEADVLGVLSMSSEFNQIQVRENELEELKVLMEDVIPCEVKGGTDTSQGKVNILLQGYISKAYIDDFALVSDTAYVAQNGGRIVRALFEIALSKKWAGVSAVLMAMSKAIEKRMWPFEHPLTQSKLSQDLLYNLQRWADEMAVVDLASQTAADLGQLVHLNEGHGKALLNAAKRFPTAQITFALRPISFTVLMIKVTIRKAFEWNTNLHGSSEPFWLWVEDAKGVDIYQCAHLAFKPATETLEPEFIIPVQGSSMPSHVTIRFISDTWLGAEEEVIVDLSNATMPRLSDEFSPLLPVPFLDFKPMRRHNLEELYTAQYSSLNGMQTQSFWTLFNSSRHSLLCAPRGSGKTLAAHFAIWHALQSENNPLVLVVSSTKTNAKDFSASLSPFKNPAINIYTVLEPDELFRTPSRPEIRTTTSTCLFRAMQGLKVSVLTPKLALVVLDDLDTITNSAEYELGASLLIHLTQTRPVRFFGMSASVMDSKDLAQWLHAPSEAVYTFRPLDREQSLQTVIKTFTIPYSSALFKSMVKPAYDALRNTLGNDTAIVFVPSRHMCRSVATDLVTQSGLEMATRGFLRGDVDEKHLEFMAARLKDRSAVDYFMRGIGIYHGGMVLSDRTLILELFAERVLRVLIMPRECCWTVPVRARIVIVMGTQYVHFDSQGGPKGVSTDRQIKNCTIPEIIQMQSRAVRHELSGTFLLFCQSEDKDTFKTFLEQGLPLESTLLDAGLPELQAWVNLKVRNGEMQSKQDLMDALSFTFLARRLKTNPMYYDAAPGKTDEALSRSIDKIWPSPEPPHTEPPSFNAMHPNQ